MRQQINLYQAAFHEPRTRLSAHTAAAVVGIVCVALLLWRVYGGRQITQLVNDVQGARAQLQRQSQFAATTGAQRAARGNPSSLQAQAKQLATQVRERQRALEFLQSGAAGAAGGFADRLEALARRHVDGVWLDHIELGSASGVSSLAGHALDANLVPRYFQALAGEPALRGARFDEFRIGEPPNPCASPAGAMEPRNGCTATGAMDSKPPPSTPGAIRFRASNAAQPPLQSRGSS
jgi:hypothetical protein